MVKEIFSFEVVVDARRKTPHYVVFFVGRDDMHIMDWRGCNFKRCKAPNQPVFTSIVKAIEWAEKNKVRHVDVGGSHVADHDNVWKAKLVAEDGQIVHKWNCDNEELTQEQWEELKQEVNEARKNPERWSS